MNRNLLVGIIVVLVLALVGGGAVFFFKKSTKPPTLATEEEEEETLKELPLENRPYVALIPGASCEYTLSLDNISKTPESIEYEIIYKNEEGVTQGASGTVKPAGGTDATKKLLFGTESSGHRRCDKGVSGGTITIRYRNDEGKLEAKMETPFSIVENEPKLTLKDKLTVEFSSKIVGKTVAMGTFGLPVGKAPGKVTEGPYGVFTNAKSSPSGTVKITGSGTLYAWDGSSWEKVDGKTSDLEALILSE